MERFIYRWTERNGTITEILLGDCTAEEAESVAANHGWTVPRWWQWWRYNDCPRKSLIGTKK